MLYATGSGVKKSYFEAIKWWKKAAEQNYAPAQLYLANSYQYGDGVKKNPAEAVKWYRKAAEQGDATAQYQLGMCYYIGDGIKRNIIEAYAWIYLSLERGFKEAHRNFSILESELTPDEIKKAVRLAENYKTSF